MECFSAVTGLGVVLCVGTGWLCAIGGSRPGPTWWDSFNMRAHWRGALQVGLVAIIVGGVGQVATALTR